MQELHVRHGLLIDIDPALQVAVVCQHQTFKPRCGKEAAKMERNQGRRVRLVPGRGWKNSSHQGRDQFSMRSQDGEVADGFHQGWRLSQCLADLPGQWLVHGMLVGNGLLPKRDQRFEAQLTGKWELASLRI